MPKSQVTFQGAVPPWECDIVEHFTVPFYYEKLDQATANALLLSGLAPTDPATPSMVGCLTRYKAELRKGDVYRIETVQLEPDRLGHVLLNGVDNTVCTQFEQTLSGPVDLPVGGSEVEWESAEPTEVAEVGDGPHWISTGRDVVMPKDLGLNGQFAGNACIHRFSAASDYLRASFGMTSSYLSSENVGFSTFSFDFRLLANAPLGTGLRTDSCVAHIGNSSLRMVHRLTRVNDGVEVARLVQAGVHLDMTQRRPSPFPAALADTARTMLAP